MTEHAEDFEVISAFVDDEPFEADKLARALAHAEGRELLIDMVALRHVIADAGAGEQLAARPVAGRWRSALAAAAIVSALAGGYLVGRQMEARNASDASSVPATLDAPAPTRVIELKPGVDWQPINGGK